MRSIINALKLSPIEVLEIAKCDHHLGQDYLGLYAQDVILNKKNRGHQILASGEGAQRPGLRGINKPRSTWIIYVIWTR